ncbi:MAG: hypothetical protein ACKVOK_07945 [Flavobacteriales bacterium]
MKVVLKVLILAVLVCFMNRCQHGNLNPDAHSINPIIGNESWREIFGKEPDGTEDQQLRIQTHLRYVENVLRNKDDSHLSPDEQKKRMQMLDLLCCYWQRGQFPMNTQYENQRRPCFIDDNGTICAVGYLVEQTAGLEFAQRINEQFQYAYIGEMEMPELDKWISESGFTAEEIATIQPSYPHSRPTRKYMVGGIGMSARSIKPGFPSAVLGYESVTDGFGSLMMRYESLGPKDFITGLRMGAGLLLNQESSFGFGIGPTYFQDNGRSGMNLKADCAVSVFYATRERKFIPELKLSYGYDFALSNKSAFPLSRDDFALHLLFKWNYKTKSGLWG